MGPPYDEEEAELKEGANGSIAEGRRPKLSTGKSSEDPSSSVGEISTFDPAARFAFEVGVLGLTAKGLGFVGRGAPVAMEMTGEAARGLALAARRGTAESTISNTGTGLRVARWILAVGLEGVGPGEAAR